MKNEVSLICGPLQKFTRKLAGPLEEMKQAFEKTYDTLMWLLGRFLLF